MKPVLLLALLVVATASHARSYLCHSNQLREAKLEVSINIRKPSWARLTEAKKVTDFKLEVESDIDTAPYWFVQRSEKTGAIIGRLTFLELGGATVELPRRKLNFYCKLRRL